MSKNKKKQRYFVLHLGYRDFKPSPTVKYEIQILDSKGRAKVSGYVDKNQNELEVDGQIIPRAVIEAAHRQPKSDGVRHVILACYFIIYSDGVGSDGIR